MKNYSKYAVWALLASAPLVVSCSDDDEPKLPSREIVKVDIYKSDSENDLFQKTAQYQFGYDERNRVKDVRTEYKSQKVTYNYGTNKMEYTWTGSDPAIGGTFVTRFEATMRSGRVHVGSVDYEAGSETDAIYNYSYHYSGSGYLSDATFGSSQSFSYEWGNTSMVITSRPSKYDAEYLYSKVANDYSFDLNVLPLLVDSRTNVLMELNAYAQLAGALGARYPKFLEDKDYAYDYLFDADGRLVQIVQEPASTIPTKQETYWFMIHYGE